VISGLQDISASDLAELPSPLNEKNWWQEFVLKLPNYLLMRLLRLHYSYIYEMLYFGGVITEEISPERKEPIREFDWDQLGDLFSNPTETLVEKYKWANEFDHNSFVMNLWRLMKSFSLKTQYTSIAPSIVDEFYEGVGSSGKEIRANIIPDHMLPSSGFFKPTLGISPVPHKTQSDEYGLFLNVQLFGDLPSSIDLLGDWSLDFSETIDVLEEAIGITIHHDEIKFVATKPDEKLALKFIGEPDEPWLLFGKPDGMRLELSRLIAEIGMKQISGGKPEVMASVTTKNGVDEGLKLYLTTD